MHYGDSSSSSATQRPPPRRVASGSPMSIAAYVTAQGQLHDLVARTAKLEQLGADPTAEEIRALRAACGSLRSSVKSQGRFNDESLIKCAVEDEVELCRKKLAAGSDPSSATPVGQTALHIAAIWGSVGVGALLIDAGATIEAHNDMGGITPLMCAAQRNRTEFARLLLARGADPKTQDESGRVAFMFAQDDELRKLLGAPADEARTATTVRFADCLLPKFNGDYILQPAKCNGRPHWHCDDKSEHGLHLYWGPQELWLLRSIFVPTEKECSAYCASKDEPFGCLETWHWRCNGGWHEQILRPMAMFEPHPRRSSSRGGSMSMPVRAKHRFSVGTTVECYMGERDFVPGVVVALDYSEDHWPCGKTVTTSFNSHRDLPTNMKPILTEF